MSQHEHQPELLGQLDTNDFTQKGSVIAIFEDGSFFSFRHAFYRHESDFVVVYTEHCGYHSFNNRSLKSIERVH